MGQKAGLELLLHKRCITFASSNTVRYLGGIFEVDSEAEAAAAVPERFWETDTLFPSKPRCKIFLYDKACSEGWIG